MRRPSRSVATPVCPAEAAIKWTRLSCRTFAANAVRLQLHALAYNLGNFMRTLAIPKAVEPWSLTSLREKLIKIGAKVVSHGRYVTFQMAEVTVSRLMFRDILMLIARLRAPPAPVCPRHSSRLGLFFCHGRPKTRQLRSPVPQSEGKLIPRCELPHTSRPIPERCPLRVGGSGAHLANAR
jgi:Transposase DDE domain group 1